MNFDKDWTEAQIIIFVQFFSWKIRTDVGQKFAPPNQQSRKECIVFFEGEWGGGGRKSNSKLLKPFPNQLKPFLNLFKRIQT